MAIRKIAEIKLKADPYGRSEAVGSGFKFYSYDKDSAAIDFYFRNQDGSPTDIMNCETELMLLIKEDDEQKKITVIDSEVEIVSALKGHARYVIPDRLRGYVGLVQGYVYLNFPDKSRTDECRFDFTIERSLIEEEFEDGGDYYIKDIQVIFDEVKDALNSKIPEMQTEYDNLVKTFTDYANEKISEYDSRFVTLNSNLLTLQNSLTTAQNKVTTLEKSITTANTNLNSRIDEISKKIDEQTEIFNNADVYNKAEIEDKLEPFALMTDIDTLETSLVAVLSDANKFRTDIETLGMDKADKTALANTNQQVSGLASNKVDKGGTNQVTWGMLDQESKENISGDKVAIVGKNSVSGISNIIDNSVPLSDLNDDLKNNLAEFINQNLEVKTGFLTYASTNVNTININSLYKTVVSECESGQVWNCDTTIDTSGTSAVIFWKPDGTFLSDLERATGKTYNNFRFSIPENCGYVSATSLSSGVVPVLRLMTLKNIPNMEAEIKNAKDRLLIYVNQDLEVKTGFLTYASSNVSSRSAHSGYRTVVSDCSPGQVWSLDTTVDDAALSACIFWREDGTFLTDLDRGADKTFIGYQVSAPENAYFISVTSLASGVIPVLRLGASGNIDSLDKRIVNLESEMGNTFKNKVIVNFGDSIYGNTPAPKDISTVIASKLGATVHNLGFGGCMMAKRVDGTVNGEEQSQYDAFGMHALSYSIANADWTAQEAALGAGNTLPAYFRPSYNLAKSLDFGKVDICTIEYGTNDWTHIAGSYQIDLDNLDNPYDISTYKGALRYSIENLYQINPKMQIILTSPTYRFWLNSDGTFLDDSDTRVIRNRKLTDFVQAMKEVAMEYKLPFLDNYHELSFNKYNRDVYFSGNDGTHPVPVGNIVIGSKIANFIKSNCW